MYTSYARAHAPNIGGLRLFLGHSGSYDKADEVSADPRRLPPSAPGFRSGAQRKHEPHCEARPVVRNRHDSPISPLAVIVKNAL